MIAEPRDLKERCDLFLNTATFCDACRLNGCSDCLSVSHFITAKGEQTFCESCAVPEIVWHDSVSEDCA